MSKDPANESTVPVFTTNDEMQARMVQELLRNNGIESTINSEAAPGLFPVNTGHLARHDILVLESAADTAREVIAEATGEEADSTTGEGEA